MIIFIEVHARVISPGKTETEPAYVDRAKIPGGWLVRTMSNGLAMTFVPDPDHSWNGFSLM